MSSAERILIAGPGHLGDLLRTTPAIEVIRRNRPDGFLCVLTKTRSAGVLEHNPAVDLVLPHDATRARWYSPTQIFLRRQLRRLCFDRVVNFSESPFVMDLVSRGIAPEVHTVDLHDRENRVAQWLRAVNGIGYPGWHDSLVLPVPPERIERIRATLALAGHPVGGRLAGIQVGSRDVARGRAKPGGRHWPPDRISALADALAADDGFTVVLTGNGRECEVAAEIRRSASRPPLDLSGRLDLAGLAALVQVCDVFVSPDTGPMHVAASRGTPLVALFGPSSPVEAGPWMAADRFVIVQRRTMEEIGVAEVHSAVREVLARGEGV